MDKLDYYMHQFWRTRNKKYENYCVERIITKLDNENLQFVTQQLFRRNDNKIALADLYFPQIKVSVEIDEAYHKSNEANDKQREQEISVAMASMETIIPFEPSILRIDADVTFERINEQIDNVVKIIQDRVSEIGDLKWDLDVDNVALCIEKGFISDEDNIEFHTIQEISNLFSKAYKGMQRCYFPTKTKTDNIYVWCPKLHIQNTDFNVPFENTISIDGCTIYESAKENNDRFVQDILNEKGQKQIRYVFPFYKTASGSNAYVYKGIFNLNAEETKRINKRVWRKLENSTIDLSQYKK